MRVGLDLVFLEPGRTGGRETYVRELCAAFKEGKLPGALDDESYQNVRVLMNKKIS